MREPTRRTSHVLDNGLRLLIEEDHLAPAVAVNLWYGVGSRHEEVGRTGLAHLFEHLMYQGSAHVASGEHVALLDAMGAQMNATTSQDRTNYFATVPVAGLDLALWLEADRLGGLLPALDQTNLDNQRDVVRNERRERQDNQPYGNAWERLFESTFPLGHQYHHLPIGSMADVTAATLDDVRAFFVRHYVPGNAVLSVVGAVSPFDVVRKVERYFGGIDPGTLPPARPPQVLAARGVGERIHIDDEDVPLPAVYLLWPVPADGDPALVALEIAAHVLTNAGSSRLGTELVRRQQVATDVAAGVDRLVGGSSTLVVRVIGTEGSDPLRLLDVVEEQIRRFADQPLTDEELAAAVASTEMQWLRTTETLGGRADSLSHGLCLFDDPDHDAAVVDSLRGVTVDDVARAVRTWLEPARATALTYRPAAQPTTTRTERELAR